MKIIISDTFMIAGAVLMLSLAASCTRESLPDVHDEQEIVLNMDGGNIDFTVTTKGSELTTLPSTLYWGASTGSGTETVKWAASSKAVSGGKISTGHYIKPNAVTYNHYVSNFNFTVGTNAVTEVVDYDDDLVCGRVSNAGATPSVTLNHVMGRIGTLSFSASGVTASNKNWMLSCKGSGTGYTGRYNITTGTWSEVSSFSDFQLVYAGGAATVPCNMNFVPGTYTITLDCNMTKGGTTIHKTLSAELTLVAGRKVNITATANSLDFDWDDSWEDGGEIEL